MTLVCFNSNYQFKVIRDELFNPCQNNSDKD